MRRRIRRLSALGAVLALFAIPSAAFGAQSDGGTADGESGGDSCVPRGTAGDMCPP
jgi:hypothetical protein